MLFMLENCSELKKLRHSLIITITYSDLPSWTNENMLMVAPISTVFTTSTWREPKVDNTRTEMNFMPIAAAAEGIINKPDFQAGRPRPSWYSSGSRKGKPPTPRRVKNPPATDTRKVRMRNNIKRSKGYCASLACQM